MHFLHGQKTYVDDLEVTGKEMLHQRYGPLLQGFRQHGVVGVSEGLLNNAPGIVPFKAFQIHQYTLKFWNSQCRVSVIELDSHLVGELLP